jgi:hypothetical protein
MAAVGAIRRRHSPNGSIQWPSSEALDVLHQAMCPASYRCIAVAIEIVVDLPAFFVLSMLLLATTKS